LFFPFLAALNKDLAGVFSIVPGVKTGRIERVGLIVSLFSRKAPAILLEGKARIEVFDLFLESCRWGGEFWGQRELDARAICIYAGVICWGYEGFFGGSDVVRRLSLGFYVGLLLVWRGRIFGG
jgi:hypothetical protein